jgi:hypothetical protein
LHGGDINPDLEADEKLDFEYFLGLRWETAQPASTCQT